MPATGLIVTATDGQTNGWGQYFDAPATPGTYYLWMLAQGAGNVTLYYGAVDGDCSMSSMGDDVKTGSIKLSEKTARNDVPAGNRSMYAMLAFVPIIAGVFSRRRRK